MLTPLREPGGRIVFVNRGFIPAELRDRSKRMGGEPTGPLRIEGLLRLPPEGRPNWFLPDNRPDLNYWFWVDLPAMAAADKLDRLAPFYIDADATPNPGGWPKGGVTRLALCGMLKLIWPGRLLKNAPDPSTFRVTGTVIEEAGLVYW